MDFGEVQQFTDITHMNPCRISYADYIAQLAVLRINCVILFASRVLSPRHRSSSSSSSSCMLSAKVSLLDKDRLDRYDGHEGRWKRRVWVSRGTAPADRHTPSVTQSSMNESYRSCFP